MKLPKYVVAAAAASILVASQSALAQEYDFTCQTDSRYIRIAHLQDVSPDVENFTVQGLLGGALSQFDVWASNLFSDGVAQGIYRFSDKQIYTGAGGFCADLFAPLSLDPITPTYDSLPLASGINWPTRSVLDVLWRLRSLDWNSPIALGRRVAFVYTSSPVHLVAGPPLLPFDQTNNCEFVDYPSVAEVQAELDANFVTVIFVVPPALVEEYRNLFSTQLVVPLSTVPDAQFEALFNALHSVYCPVPIPTQEPGGTSPTVIFTDPTITEEPPCTENAILQLLHIQDISYSYTNDLQNMINKFPSLINDLQNQFFSCAFALASFSDKPVFNSGYPGDVCYREDFVFSPSTDSFIAALNDLEIISGRDWKESQYDALYDGTRSNTLGWETADEVDGRVVVRVALVATDAGPHVAGDVPLPAGGPDCETRDYPSPSDLASALSEAGVYPIFVVTSDIYNLWVGKAAELSPSAVVLQLADDPSLLFQAIQDYLEDICAARPMI